VSEQTYRIALSGYDEARALYVEELAQMSPEQARLAGEAEPTPERAAELQRTAQEIRAAAEHGGDEVVILAHRPFGAVLDAQAALTGRDFAGAALAVLRNAIVSWRIGGDHGESVTDDWLRSQDGDLMRWLKNAVEEHWESVRRTAPKVTTTST